MSNKKIVLGWKTINEEERRASIKLKELHKQGFLENNTADALNDDFIIKINREHLIEIKSTKNCTIYKKNGVILKISGSNLKRLKNTNCNHFLVFYPPIKKNTLRITNKSILIPLLEQKHLKVLPGEPSGTLNSNGVLQNQSEMSIKNTTCSEVKAIKILKKITQMDNSIIYLTEQKQIVSHLCEMGNNDISNLNNLDYACKVLSTINGIIRISTFPLFFENLKPIEFQDHWDQLESIVELDSNLEIYILKLLGIHLKTMKSITYSRVDLKILKEQFKLRILKAIPLLKILLAASISQELNITEGTSANELILEEQNTIKWVGKIESNLAEPVSTILGKNLFLSEIKFPKYSDMLATNIRNIMDTIEYSYKSIKNSYKLIDENLSRYIKKAVNEISQELSQNSNIEKTVKSKNLALLASFLNAEDKECLIKNSLKKMYKK